MYKRLHIGAGRLENLPEEVSKIFLDESWLNFGDDSKAKIKISGRAIELLRQRSILKLIKKIPYKISRILHTDKKLSYNAKNFLRFFYKKGDILPFSDNTFTFIYSEHFFEHLFFDEASWLFKELFRILKPGGVIRTVVPDADLRVYERAEMVGAPDKKMPFTHPWKHKTRWNVYMLEELLNLIGFKTVALCFCDKNGVFTSNLDKIPNLYNDEHILDPEMVFDTRYIIRKKSLIIDAIKVIK